MRNIKDKLMELLHWASLVVLFSFFATLAAAIAGFLFLMCKWAFEFGAGMP